MSKIPYTLQMVDHFCLIRKILPSSNGYKLMENGHRFVKLRKYLCFCLEKNFQLKQNDRHLRNNCKMPRKKMVTCDFYFTSQY